MCEKNKLGQAKKRNTKVEITDIAIEKVPYVHYRGLTEEQNKMMYSLAKLVMRLAKDRNHSNEVAITWNIASNNPNVYGVAYGSEYAVNVSADTLSYHLLISSSEATVVMLHKRFCIGVEKLAYIMSKEVQYGVIREKKTLHYGRFGDSASIYGGNRQS